MSHWVEDREVERSPVASVGLGGITRKVLRTGERASADDPETGFHMPPHSRSQGVGRAVTVRITVTVEKA